MNYHLLQVLDSAELGRVLQSLSQHSFADGRSTASGKAREVKKNQQAERRSASPTETDNLILSAFSRNSAMKSFAIPKRVLLPTYARYVPGMEYGSHIDSSLMGGGGEQIRTDLALTLFLSEPDTYDGGELVLELPFGEQEIKLAAGEAVVYSANTLHRVAPVTRGVRLVAVTWIQSLVRDEGVRAILFDLATAFHRAAKDEDTTVAMLINKSYHNLLRHFIET